MERVRSPRKSILSIPTSSMKLPSYCDTHIFSPVSLSFAIEIGICSIRLSLPIIMAQACTPKSVKYRLEITQGNPMSLNCYGKTWAKQTQAVLYYNDLIVAHNII